MKKTISILLLVIIFATSSGVYAERIPRQQLVKGKAVSIATDYEIGDVAVSDHQVCDFMITENRKEIYLNPKKQGVVTLTVWDTNGNKKEVAPIEVYDSDVAGVADEARALFSDSNVDVGVRGRNIVLTGEATSKADLEQALSLAQRHPEVENHVTMSKEVLQTVAETVEAAIGTPGIKVRNVRGRLVLEGLAYSGASAKRALEIAKLYDPDIINLLDVKETGRRPGRESLIKLNVYFMEIKKEALRSFGVNWAPGSVPKNGGAGASTGAANSAATSGLFGGMGSMISNVVGFVFNLLPKIKTLRERGEGRVLENATFVVKSGEPADLFNGTQVPYYSGNQVTFKDVGIKLHAEPIASGDEIDLQINASLSSMAANIEGGIDTRNIATSAYVKAGYSMILANVISNRDVKTYNKTPSDVDTSSALFNLTLSKDFQTGRSEFIIFIEPVILEDSLPAEEKLKQFFETEETMIRDRSKKEYTEFLEKKGGLPPMESSGPRSRKRW